MKKNNQNIRKRFFNLFDWNLGEQLEILGELVVTLSVLDLLLRLGMWYLKFSELSSSDLSAGTSNKSSLQYGQIMIHDYRVNLRRNQMICVNNQFLNISIMEESWKINYLHVGNLEVQTDGVVLKFLELIV